MLIDIGGWLNWFLGQVLTMNDPPKVVRSTISIYHTRTVKPVYINVGLELRYDDEVLVVFLFADVVLF